MAGMSPTQLTLRKLKKEGYRAVVVEKWNPHARCRQDLFGIIDVLAVGPGVTIGVQATTYKNRHARVRKMADSDSIGDLREANWTLLVHGWRKVKNRWQCTEIDIS